MKKAREDKFALKNIRQNKILSVSWEYFGFYMKNCKDELSIKHFRDLELFGSIFSEND